ncbi:glycoside hydrolase family 28 protein [bacterium]|nr:glycoside hydrolase family 28 protein [bacterium]
MDSTFDIRNFGATPGGAADCSEAIAAAVEAARRSAGGIILVPAGTWLSGPIELGDDMTLLLEKGATLRFIDDPERYDPVETRWEGVSCYAMHPLVFARGAKNVGICGEGVLDGNGASWWEAHRRKKADRQSGPVAAIERRLAALNGATLDQPSGGGGRETQFLRPPLAQFLSCDGVTLRGVTLTNSPFWTLHPVFSTRILIDNIRIQNPSDAPNTDGIDVDSCTDVRIVDTLVDVGDDCIALKSGSGPRGVAENRPTRNISISGCTFLSGHGGVVLGSETAGGIENVDVLNCRFIGTDRGIRMKSRRGRGGIVQNLSCRNLVMERVLAPLTINLYYNCGARAEEAPALFSEAAAPVTALTPKFRNITIANLVATDCRSSAGFVVGLPESPIENMRLENCRISIAAGDLAPVGHAEMYEGIATPQERGLRLRNAACSLDGLIVEGCAGPAWRAEEGCAVFEPARL